MKILFFGTYDALLTPRVEVWKEGLTAHGDDVREINVPLEIDAAQRVKILKRPWLLPLLVVRLAAAWARLCAMSRSEPAPDAVAVGYMGHFDVQLARRLYRDCPIVLDHLISAADTAADRGSGSGLVQGLLKRLDRAALGAADICCVDTEEHLELIPGSLLPKTIVVPVGAVQAAFREPVKGDGSALRVIFFGSYTPLQGAPVIAEAIALVAGTPAPISFTMIGKGQDLAAARELAASAEDVTWLDWVDPKDMPDVLARHDVCLGIFGESPKALRVVPNKVYQGGAAGCALVTSDTKPQRRALGDDAVYVQPGSPRELCQVLIELAGAPEKVWRMRESMYARAVREFAPPGCVRPLRAALLEKTGMKP